MPNPSHIVMPPIGMGVPGGEPALLNAMGVHMADVDRALAALKQREEEIMCARLEIEAERQMALAQTYPPNVGTIVMPPPSSASGMIPPPPPPQQPQQFPQQHQRGQEGTELLTTAPTPHGMHAQPPHITSVSGAGGRALAQDAPQYYGHQVPQQQQQTVVTAPVVIRSYKTLAGVVVHYTEGDAQGAHMHRDTPMDTQAGGGGGGGGGGGQFPPHGFDEPVQAHGPPVHDTPLRRDMPQQV